VPANLPFFPGRLPAELVIVEHIRGIGWQIADAVHAAGPEAARYGRVDHSVGIDLVLRTELEGDVRFFDGLVEVGARRILEFAGDEATRLAGMGTEASAEPEEAIERVPRLEDTEAADEAQRVGDVVCRLAESRQIAIDPHFLRQPERTGPAGDAG